MLYSVHPQVRILRVNVPARKTDAIQLKKKMKILKIKINWPRGTILLRASGAGSPKTDKLLKMKNIRPVLLRLGEHGTPHNDRPLKI